MSLPLIVSGQTSDGLTKESMTSTSIKRKLVGRQTTAPAGQSSERQSAPSSSVSEFIESNVPLYSRWDRESLAKNKPKIRQALPSPQANGDGVAFELPRHLDTTSMVSSFLHTVNSIITMNIVMFLFIFTLPLALV